MTIVIQQEVFGTIGTMSVLSVFEDELKTISKQLEYFRNPEEVQDRNIEDIVKFENIGFDINMNNMIQERKYLFSFEDSKYVIWKNSSDELTIKEVN